METIISENSAFQDFLQATLAWRHCILLLTVRS